MNDLSNGALFATERDVADRIEATVLRRLGGWVRDFQVEVHDRGLVLQGRTRTYYAKQLVQHTAMTVGGLPILANCVKVL